MPATLSDDQLLALDSFYKQLRHVAGLTSSALPENIGSLIGNVVNSGGGGSTGNWAFSGNNADLSAAANMSIGSTNTNNIILDTNGTDLVNIGLSSQFGSTYYEVKGLTGIHNLGFRNVDGTGIFPQDSQMWIYASGSAVGRWNSDNLTPNNDLGLNLGASSLRWNNLFVGQDNIGTAQTANIISSNTTPATSGIQQNAPSIQMEGSGWGTTGAAAQAVSASIQGIAGTHTVGTMDLVFGLQHGGGSPTNLVAVTEVHPDYGYLAGRPTVRLIDGGVAGYIAADTELVIGVGTNNVLDFVGGVCKSNTVIQPNLDGSLSLGTANFSWGALYTVVTTLKPAAAPSAPSAGWTLYTDSSDGNKLKAIASTGTVITLGTP